MASQQAINALADYLRSKTDFYVGDILDRLRDPRYSDADVQGMQAKWEQGATQQSEYMLSEQLRAQVLPNTVTSQTAASQAAQASTAGSPTAAATPTQPDLTRHPGDQPVLAPPPVPTSGSTQSPAPSDFLKDPGQKLSDGEWAYLSRTFGTDAQAMYQGFNMNHALAFKSLPARTAPGVVPLGSTAPSSATAVTGGLSPIQRQAQQGGLFSVLSPDQAKVGVNDVEGKFRTQTSASGEQVSERDFANVMLHSAYGLNYSIAEIYASQYRADNNKEMPADLKAQIQKAVNEMPPEQVESMLDPTTGLPSGKAVSMPFFDTLVSNYEKANPSPAKALTDWHSNFDYLFKSNGIIPTDAIANQFLHASLDEMQHYIEQQPSRIKGLSIGRFNSLKNEMDSLYQDAFGHAPNDQDYLWAATRSKQEIQNHVNDSPSHIPGMTVGLYQSTSSYVSKLTTDLFGYGATDDLILGAHQAASGPATAPPPPAQPPLLNGASAGTQPAQPTPPGQSPIPPQNAQAGSGQLNRLGGAA